MKFLEMMINSLTEILNFYQIHFIVKQILPFLIVCTSILLTRYFIKIGLSRRNGSRQNGTVDEMGVDEMGIDKMGADEMGVDEVGSRRSGMIPFKTYCI